jgi:hypothetical protein
MALKVTTNTSPRISSTVNSNNTVINSSLRKVNLDLVNLEELSNIDATSLEDGYTLVYDSVNEKWVAQQVNNINNIDGGTF